MHTLVDACVDVCVEKWKYLAKGFRSERKHLSINEGCLVANKDDLVLASKLMS